MTGDSWLAASNFTPIEKFGLGPKVQFTPEQTESLLPYSKLVPAIHQAASDMHSGVLRAPERLVVPIGADSSLMCMPATAPDIAMVKILVVKPGNSSLGLPVIQGSVSVFSPANGSLIAQLDAATLTARRTAAVSLAGAECLSVARPKRVLLVGGGVQAAAHADAFADYLGVRQFVVATRSLEKAERFIEKLALSQPDVIAVPKMISNLSEEDWASSDIVICLTTSASPVVPTWLPPSVLVIGVGAYRSDMVELPSELLRARKIAVDYSDGAKCEAGDLIQAAIDWTKVLDLHDLSRTVIKSRDNWIFKTVGHSAWDLAASRIAMAEIQHSQFYMD